MSRVLVSPSRVDPHLRPYYRDWITSDFVVLEMAISGSFLSFTTITANSTIHTKAASYTTIIASTSTRATMMRVRFKNTFTSTAATSQLVDIATGATSSEVNIVSNLAAGYLNDWTGAGSPPCADYWIPVSIPAGTRLSARSQALITSDTCDVHITLYSGSNRTIAGVDTMGADETTSKGVNVVEGLSNAEGAWTQVIASTSHAYTGLLMGIQGAGDASIQGSPTLLDIGAGAGGSEVAILSDIAVSSTATEIVILDLQIPLMSVSIPAGTRLAARMQTQTSSAQTLDIILYGLY